MANIIHSDNDFARRVKALGLSYTELAVISGYNPKSIYNVSCNKRQLSSQLDSCLKILEVLAELKQLDRVLKKLREK